MGTHTLLSSIIRKSVPDILCAYYERFAAREYSVVVSLSNCMSATTEEATEEATTTGFYVAFWGISAISAE